MNIEKLFLKITENWPIKVLSLGLAIILFVFHRMSILEDRYFSVPLRVEHRDRLMPSSSYPGMVRVNLRGEANSIFAVQESDIEVYIDIEKYELPGVYTVPVQWRKLGTAVMVEPLQITVEPGEVTLSLDQRISKIVPINANFRGQVEAGHAMTSYLLNPSQVIIDGPAELIWRTQGVTTEAIDLDGRRSDFSAPVNILNSDSLIMIRGSGATEFYGNISPIIPVRNIVNVPINITGMQEGLSGELETRTASMRLEGVNQDAIAGFNPPPEFLRIDCSGIGEPGVYVLRVLAGSFVNFNLIIDPAEVTIKINHSGEE